MLALALATNLLLAAPPAPTCEVAGTIHYQDPVMIVVPHGKPFVAQLDDVATHVRFDAQAKITIAAEGPIAFSATVAKRQLLTSVSKLLPLIDGVLSIGPGMVLEVRRVKGASADVMVFDEAGLTLGPVPVSCADLTLAQPASRNEPVAVAVDAQVFARSGRGALRAGPGTGVTLPFEADGVATFERLGADHGWTQVRSRWTDGSQLTGWMKRALSERPPETLDQITSDASACDRGYTGYYGPAMLHAGALIYDAPERGHAWGTARVDIEVKVFGDRGMVELTTLPGLHAARGECSFPAYAHAEDLTYPAKP